MLQSQQATTIELKGCNCWSHARRTGDRQPEKPRQWESHTLQLGKSSCAATKTQHSQNECCCRNANMLTLHCVCVCVFVYMCYILDDKMAPCYAPLDLSAKAGCSCEYAESHMQVQSHQSFLLIFSFIRISLDWNLKLPVTTISNHLTGFSLQLSSHLHLQWRL